jgi:hypothetical protein
MRDLRIQASAGSATPLRFFLDQTETAITEEKKGYPLLCYNDNNIT